MRTTILAAAMLITMAAPLNASPTNTLEIPLGTIHLGTDLSQPEWITHLALTSTYGVTHYEIQVPYETTASGESAELALQVDVFKQTTDGLEHMGTSTDDVQFSSLTTGTGSLTAAVAVADADVIVANLEATLGSESLFRRATVGVGADELPGTGFGSKCFYEAFLDDAILNLSPGDALQVHFAETNGPGQSALVASHGEVCGSDPGPAPGSDGMPSLPPFDCPESGNSSASNGLGGCVNLSWSNNFYAACPTPAGPIPCWNAHVSANAHSVFPAPGGLEISGSFLGYPLANQCAWAGLTSAGCGTSASAILVPGTSPSGVACGSSKAAAAFAIGAPATAYGVFYC